MESLDRLDVALEHVWLGALMVGVVALLGGVLTFPIAIYDRFIYRYFWGPVHADAAAAECAVKIPGSGTELLYESEGCAARIADGAIVAEPGYTLVSTLGYMGVLVFMLVGVYFLLRRVDLEPYSRFFFALVPFMLFGGALRVVEDATDAAVDAGVEPAITYPLNTLLISPIIYGTVFVLALVALFVAKGLHRHGLTKTYQYPLSAIGLFILLGTIVYLTVLAFTRNYVDFHPLVLVTVATFATLTAGGVLIGSTRYAPSIIEGTGLVGGVVVWGHAIDGFANVIAADWTHLFGINITYGAKNVFNRFIVDITGIIQPEWLTAAIGDSWPFPIVKVAVATGILVLFDEDFIMESPRYSIMLLGAIAAVGMGPGTRDVLRVTFGI